MVTQKDIENQGFTLSSDIQTPVQLRNQKASPILSSQEEILSKEDISEDHVLDTKYTMQSLCRSFIKKYANSSDRIEPSLVATEFNAKLRRVYDLTNILEGGGIIQKVEKGIYKWRGLNIGNQLPFDTLKNDWCSLRGIAFEIKRLCNKMKKGLTCNDLYGILTDGNKNNFNPATIRRKIYECCKVFVIVGLIQKSGKYFYSAKMTNQEIQSLKKQKKEDKMIDETQKMNLSQQNQLKPIEAQQNQRQTGTGVCENYKIENPLKLQQRKAIIRKIANQIQSQSDLSQFIQDLSFQYRSKRIPFVTVKKQDDLGLFTQSSQSFNFNQWSPISSAQIQRNIIISSPIKDQYPQFFGLNNNNSCYFPSLTGFSPFSSLHDIKGK